MVVVVCVIVNWWLFLNYEWVVKYMIGFYFFLMFVVCEFCLRGKLKSFIMLNVILFVCGSIY